MTRTLTKLTSNIIFSLFFLKINTWLEIPFGIKFFHNTSYVDLKCWGKRNPHLNFTQGSPFSETFLVTVLISKLHIKLRMCSGWWNHTSQFKNLLYKIHLKQAFCQMPEHFFLFFQFMKIFFFCHPKMLFSSNLQKPWSRMRRKKSHWPEIMLTNLIL